MSILAWTAKKEPAASGEPGDARSLDCKFYPNITGVYAQATTVARRVQPVPLYNFQTFYSEIIGENSLLCKNDHVCCINGTAGRAGAHDPRLTLAQHEVCRC
jgi:hypothetical protein